MGKENIADALAETLTKLDSSKPLETQLTDLITFLPQDTRYEFSKKLADAYAKRGSRKNEEHNLVNAARVLAFNLKLDPNLIGTGIEEQLEGYERELAQKKLIYLAAQVAVFSGTTNRLETYAFIEPRVLDLKDFYGRKASELIGKR